MGDCLRAVSLLACLTPLPLHSRFNCVSQPGLDQVLPAPAASMDLPLGTPVSVSCTVHGTTHPTDFTIAAHRQSHRCIARVQFIVAPHPALHIASPRGAAEVPCGHALQAPVGWIGVTRRSSRCGFVEATCWRDGLLGWLQAKSLVTVRSNARHPPHFLMSQIGTPNAATT